MATRGPFPVQIERDGRIIDGTYTVEGSGPTATVTVTSEGKTESSQAGNSGEEETAKRLLSQTQADFRRPAR